MLHTLKYLTKSITCPIAQGHHYILSFTGNLKNLQAFLLAFSKHRKYITFHVTSELPLINIFTLHIGILCSKIQFPHYTSGACY